MVLLFESGCADQNDIARCFGYSARTLRRYQERLKEGGLSALARPEGRAAGHRSEAKEIRQRDQTILRLKAQGMSNRWIAGRLGLSEKAVRKNLRRLGWLPGPEPELPLLPEADSQAKRATVSGSKVIEIPPSAVEQPARKKGATGSRFGSEKSRYQPSGSVHGSPLGRRGTPRRCAPAVCSDARSAQSRCVVGDSNAHCQWPTPHG